MLPSLKNVEANGISFRGKPYGPAFQKRSNVVFCTWWLSVRKIFRGRNSRSVFLNNKLQFLLFLLLLLLNILEVSNVLFETKVVQGRAPPVSPLAESQHGISELRCLLWSICRGSEVSIKADTNLL